MDINQLTIGQPMALKNIFQPDAKAAEQPALDAHLIGKPVIIRTYSAGVHFGILDARQGAEVRLKDARRIWYWNKAFTLSKVALDGIDHATSKLSVTIPEIVLTEAIEIIPVSANAFQNIVTAAAHSPE